MSLNIYSIYLTLVLIIVLILDGNSQHVAQAFASISELPSHISTMVLMGGQWTMDNDSNMASREKIEKKN